jgi:hypothetical protein
MGWDKLINEIKNNAPVYAKLIPQLPVLIFEFLKKYVKPQNS